MNVLETLKINKATVLELKDNDILFIKIEDDTDYKSTVELHNSLLETFKEKGLKNITIWISKNVNDFKIIRR